ncbi:MAG: hypothetical protein ACI4MK_03120 [Aristaeellaceae bacterium]
MNLEQAPENVMGPIEIDVEPETWIPPHQQPTPEPVTPLPPQEPEAPQPSREEQPVREEPAQPEQAAAQTLSPELMRMYRGNQHMYIFRMLLLIIVALCLLLNNWLYNGHRTADFISMSLFTVAPGMIVGFWGLFGSITRLRKTSGELAAQVSASSDGALSLFSFHERIVLKWPFLGIWFSVGALYAAFLILESTPLMHIVHNLSMLGRLGGRYWWDALDKAGAGIACSAMLLFCLSYPIRTLRLLMLRGKVTQSK